MYQVGHCLKKTEVNPNSGRIFLLFLEILLPEITLPSACLFCSISTSWAAVTCLLQETNGEVCWVVMYVSYLRLEI